MRTTTKLRSLLNQSSGPLVLPGAANSLFALLIEEAEFPAAYVSGAGLANTHLGAPDVGLVTMTELVHHVAAMSEAVSIPLVVDADTGFGNALNVRRTVRSLELAGAAAIQLEDQVAPKRCGHFAGKQLIPAAEMIAKIQAACDARTDDDLMIIARTDAIAVDGLGEALRRITAYRDAGADVMFVEAPRTVDDMRVIVQEAPGLHMANMVEGGLTPLLDRRELADLGFAIALYANSAMRGAALGARKVLAHLAEHGNTQQADALMISWSDRQSLVGKDRFDELERRYSGQEDPRDDS